MSLSIYTASAPVLIRYLSNLKAILEKAQAFCEQKKIEPSVLLNSRLAPDMYPLTAQIQLASDMAKSCLSRLAGTEVPSFPDTETTFAELYARIDKTVAHIKTFKPEQIDNSEARKVSVRGGDKTFEMDGQSYLSFFLLPNFFFHVTNAYAIMRHNGVSLGKMDYLGG